MTATIHKLPIKAPRKLEDFGLDRIELAMVERNLRQLHRERDEIGAVVEERLLMLRALAAIAQGHYDPRSLAEAVIVIVDRASDERRER